MPLLTDKNHEMSKKYGVFSEAQCVSYKSLFLIDQASVIRHIAINGLTVAVSALEALRIVDTIATTSLDKRKLNKPHYIRFCLIYSLYLRVLPYALIKSHDIEIIYVVIKCVLNKNINFSKYIQNKKINLKRCVLLQ